MGSVTKTVSGSIASFVASKELPIKSLKIPFSPVQAGSGDPSPSNVRAISGWDSIVVTRCGKNLLGCDTYADRSVKGIDFTGTRNSEGELVSITVAGKGDNRNIFTNLNFESSKCKWPPNGRYATSAYTNSVNVIPVRITSWVEDTSGNNASSYTIGEWKHYDLVHDDSEEWFRLQVAPYDSTNVEHNTVVYPMVCIEEDAGCEFEPYHGNTFTIPFPSTFYGGYIDLISGELVQECRMVVFNGSENWSDDGAYNGHRFSIGLSNALYGNGENFTIACNYLKPTPNGTSAQTIYGSNTASIALRSSRIYVAVDFVSTVNDWKAYLAEHNLEVVYKTATPIRYQLTPQQLRTLKGRNNIWADTGESVEVVYDLFDTTNLFLNRRRIMLNTPHVETVSGSVAHFNTDMAAKLKECKVNFLPQQAGSGDPSPSNVRAISGWTGCDVWKAKKNVAHIVGYSAQNIASPTLTRSLTNNYGTSISTTDFSLPDTAVTITQSQAPNETVASYRNGYISVIVDNLKFGETYNISFKVSNITSNPLNATLNNVQVFSPVGSGGGVLVDGDRVHRNIVFSQDPNIPNKMSFEIRICGMSFTLSEFMVTPVEDEDYTFEPYNGSEIPVFSGKNLWNNENVIYGVWTNNNGNVGNDVQCCRTQLLSTNGGETYTCYFNGLYNNNILYSCSFIELDSNQSFIQRDHKQWYGQPAQNVPFTVTLTENTKYFYVQISCDYVASGAAMSYEMLTTYKVQLELGSAATDYEPYIGTIYGGYVDLVRGELVQEWKMVDFGDLNWTKMNNYDVFLANVSDIEVANRQNVISEIYKFFKAGASAANMPDKLIKNHDTNTNLYCKDLDYTTASDFIAATTGRKIVYKLATQITYPLSPEIIKTLKGANNVFSDANGDVTVKYWTH